MTQIIMKLESGRVLIREDGKFLSVPAPAFEHKQIVKSSGKHYSKDSFTMVLEPTWSKVRGWIYGQRYISRGNYNGGGQGWWNEEWRYEPLTDADDILLAKKMQLEEDKRKATAEVKAINIKIRHIDYARSLLIKE